MDGQAESLLNGLKEYFGHQSFRGHQQEVVQAALAGRDVAVVWTTGAGKSLCYQLPAVLRNQTVLVVSPLISLMQDQVHRFNATVGAQGTRRACFLGSAQPDRSLEAKALQGEYCLVYVTPEKLTSNDFLERLKLMGSKLLLVAIDEAHCISEWGHDFRPSYRELKRVREVLATPIMALTATAAQRVQDDLIAQLQMRQPLISKSSLDRPNLEVRCSRKSSRDADLKKILAEVQSGGSSIVYAMTQSETEMLASFLGQKLRVAAYHGGLSMGEREEAHVSFLNGQIQVIVATVAFGMGIDKPDVRRIIHYGPPKTVEEYFQQIGRAGRDGLDAVVELISSDQDFSKYSSEFYLQGLSPTQRQQQLASTQRLRDFASSGLCRRRWLLEFFGEKPSWQRCGRCDCCGSAAAERDFSAAVAPILRAVACTQRFPQALTNLLSIITGSYKPKTFSSITGAVAAAQPEIQALRNALPAKMKKDAFVRELILLLCSTGYLQRQTVTGSNTFNRTFEVYALSQQGQQALTSKTPIILPMSVTLRQLEEEEERQLLAKKKEIAKFGLDAQDLPADALEDGPVLWYIRKLQHWKESGKPELLRKAEAHEALRAEISKWRDAAAVRLRLAPAAVLPEHLVVALTYVQPTSLEDLRSAGVRIQGAEELAALIAKAKGSNGDEGPQSLATPAKHRAPQMQLPAGAVTPPMKWPGAVYKATKNGKPPWEQSYDRFSAGESLQSIAMKPAAGRPIQVSTVQGHVFTAWTFGKAVDLQRLVQQAEMALPSQVEWTLIEEAAVALKADPASEVKLKDLLANVLGEGVLKEPDAKSEEEKELERQWYGHLKLWDAFRKVGFSPGFEEDAKRQRVE